MITSIIATVIYSFIPPEYLPLVALVVAFLLGVSEWLTKTKRLQANSILQLFEGVLKKLAGKTTPLLSRVEIPDQNPIQALPQNTTKGPEAKPAVSKSMPSDTSGEGLGG